MAKRVPKQTKRRLAILGPISLVIIVYFLINLATYSYKLITLSREEKKLKDNGFECYSFGNLSNEEIGCGQLVQNKISNNN